MRTLTNACKFLLIGAAFIMASSLSAGPGLYGFTLNSIDGKPAPLADYKGKVVLIVNVASQCGYTPQYSALESIYEKYKGSGILLFWAFPRTILVRKSRGATKRSRRSAPGSTASAFRCIRRFL